MLKKSVDNKPIDKLNFSSYHIYNIGYVCKYINKIKKEGDYRFIGEKL